MMWLQGGRFRAFGVFAGLVAGALALGCASGDESPAAGSGQPGVGGEQPGASGGGAGAPGGEAPGAETLALTPPMGFNNWNAFGCDVNETLILETADFFTSSGLKDVGYEFVNIDDCWAMMERGADGRLVPDPIKFPSGIAGVADYVHSLGLKLGIYADAGTRTCAGYPGSLGNEELDAQTFADWGVDYVKYDNCYNQSDGSREDFVRRYSAMHLAIEKTGRPIVYSICEWGQSQPWEWATGIGQLWRTTGDINDSWSSIRDIIAFNATLSQYAGPGHWNDPDMLEIGNGALSEIEKRTHMSMWSMMAAPLIIGTDLRLATEETLVTLANPEIIAIDQDRLGVQGALVANDAGLMVLAKPLESGEVAVALYNSTDAQALVSSAGAGIGLTSDLGYHLLDVWSGAALAAKSAIAAGVPAHGTVVYRVRPLAASDAVPPSVTVAGTLGTLTPGASEPATLLTRVVNHGISDANQVALSVRAPAGWTITALTEPAATKLATDAARETTWQVQVPEGTLAGRYPVTVTADFTWSEASSAASTSGELSAAVAVAPADGATPLSSLLPVSSSNGLGPVEIDSSNGAATERDGNLITIGGKVYTRGLGTHAPSRVGYYLGARCSSVAVDVGIDDEVGDGPSAAFEIYADGMLVAQSGVLTGAAPASSLTADVTGASLLELVTVAGATATDAHADWAAPTVYCGGSTTPTVAEQTLFSFETGTEEFTIANAAAGGTLVGSALFATDGERGLEVTAPADGNWYGKRFTTPLDLSAFQSLRYDVKTGPIGTPGEFALEVGAGSTWCQGGEWTWTNANASKTIERPFDRISCPAGVTLDPAQIRGIWLFLKDGTFQIDNVRAR